MHLGTGPSGGDPDLALEVGASEGPVAPRSAHPSANRQLRSISALDPKPPAWAHRNRVCDCAGKAKRSRRDLLAMQKPCHTGWRFGGLFL